MCVWIFTTDFVQITLGVLCYMDLELFNLIWQGVKEFQKEVFHLWVLKKEWLKNMHKIKAQLQNCIPYFDFTHHQPTKNTKVRVSERSITNIWNTSTSFW